MTRHGKFAAAKTAGENYYHGAACKDCGGTRRRVSSRGCVRCKKRKERAKRYAEV